MVAHGADKTTQLPYSRVDLRTGQGTVGPRGCELSWRIALLADLDPDLARRLYARYVKAFWLDRTIVAGFAEWPFGRAGRQDLDSGPVVMGIGATASAFGLAAAKAAADEARYRRLCRQMADSKAMLKLLIALKPAARGRYTLGGKIDPDSAYDTGFLFGDACLLYAVTWRPWCAAGGRGPSSKPARTRSLGSPTARRRTVAPIDSLCVRRATALPADPLSMRNR
jgi:hypothetical protein